jgi:hypothetical protein
VISSNFCRSKQEDRKLYLTGGDISPPEILICHSQTLLLGIHSRNDLDSLLIHAGMTKCANLCILKFLTTSQNINVYSGAINNGDCNVNKIINKNKFVLLATLALIALASSSLYPRNYPPRFQVGINFLLAFPQDEFNEIVKQTGFGVAGEFLYSFPLVPVSIGLAGGYIIYGNDSRRERFSLTIPDVYVDVKTTNNIATGHFLLRVSPRQGSVRPYLDGLIGFNYLFTQTKINSQGTGDEVASSTNFDDSAFSYGGGGGLLITLYQDKKAEDGLAAVNLDLRLRYLFGSEAEYLKKGSIEISGGDVFYNVSKSVTDIITFQIGVTLEF